MSVLMLALFGARERSVTDYEALLAAAGPRLVDVRPTSGPLCVLEGSRSDSPNPLIGDHTMNPDPDRTLALVARGAIVAALMFGASDATVAAGTTPPDASAPSMRMFETPSGAVEVRADPQHIVACGYATFPLLQAEANLVATCEWTRELDDMTADVRAARPARGHRQVGVGMLGDECQGVAKRLTHRSANPELGADLWEPAGSMHEHDHLARRGQRQLGAVVRFDQGEREIHTGGDTRRCPHVAVAHIDLVGVDIDSWVPRRECLTDGPVRGCPPVIGTTDGAYDGLAPNRLAIAKTSRGSTTSSPRNPGNVTMTTARGSRSAAERTSPCSTRASPTGKDTDLTDSATVRSSMSAGVLGYYYDEDDA